MGRKIKLGIIGTGLAAKILHLPALKRLNDKFEITAVCNHTDKKAREFSELLAENFRYRKVYNSVKDLLKNKSIGKVYAAQWNVFYQVTSDNDYGATKWRQKHKYVGGFMLDAGVHNIAAFRMLFGEIKSVAAFTDSINPQIGKPDTMSVQIIFHSGIKVIYNLFFTVKHHWENKLLVFGDKGTIEVNDDMISLKLNDSKPQIIDASDFGGYDEEFLDFYNAIVNNKKVRSAFSDGYKDMEVVFAALKSAEKNKVIYLK